MPDWLYLWISQALLGEVYPSIRRITASFDENRKLTISYYLDREPTDFDFESISMVATSIESNTSHADEIKGMELKCIYLKDKEKEKLPGVYVYSRREYELE